MTWSPRRAIAACAAVPLEFALRPRFRLDERVATPRRRELSPLLLPVAAYWLGTATLTYRLVYAAPGENAREPIAVTTTESVPEPPSPAPLAMVDEPILPAQVPGSLPSLEHEALEPAAVPARLEPAPARAATPNASPREPVSPRRTAVEPELPFVPPAQSSVPPRFEPAPEP